MNTQPTEMTEFCTVFITAGTEAETEALARSLVEQRLAACCSILPGVRSVYRWQDAIEENAEFLLEIKTRRDKFEELERYVHAIHSYDVPEILCLPVLAGSGPYLEWLAESLGT